MRVPALTEIGSAPHATVADWVGMIGGGWLPHDWVKPLGIHSVGGCRIMLKAKSGTLDWSTWRIRGRLDHMKGGKGPKQKRVARSSPPGIAGYGHWVGLSATGTEGFLNQHARLAAG